METLVERPVEPQELLTGFRLERLEVYNWGTFHNRVWHYQLDSRNSLLTGNIGSGKSTLVDALTTLLVPAHRVQYNRAAGADKKERSLLSYVLGYYKKEKGEAGGPAKPVPLREHNSFSVILCVFSNKGFEEKVTLAQVFWMKELQGQPARFYAVAREELTIDRDFSNFGTKLSQLRRNLRDKGVELFDSFPQYGATFRRYLGLPSEQALELFHQTISLKTVGNLTDFVREHMLEEFDVEPRIENLIAHYENLDRAYRSVLKAKHQVELLTPLVNDCDKLEDLLVETLSSRQQRDALAFFFADLKTQLIKIELKRLETKQGKVEATLSELKLKRSELEAERGELQLARSQNGGDRLERLAVEIAERQEERKRRSRRAELYGELVSKLDFAVPQSSDEFLEQKSQFKALTDQLKRAETDRDNRRVELMVQRRSLEQQHSTLTLEIDGLRSRRSNINQQQILFRDELCSALELPTEKLPFVGELLRVKDSELDWEGAIERILHNFALSLLVPDELYKRVSTWVDQTRLRGRLVYYRVAEDSWGQRGHLPENALPEKLEIKKETTFYGWLDRQLRRRFDYVCCPDLSQFRREKKAVTLRGQMKSGGGRHEKDDRYDISDRSRYVLGWSNEQKIAVLERQLSSVEDDIFDVVTELHEIQIVSSESREKQSALSTMEGFQDFRELDWRPLVKEIADLEEERKRLEESSDILAQLTRSIEEVGEKLLELQKEWDKANGDLGAIKDNIDTHQIELLELEELFGPAEQREFFPALETFCQTVLDMKPVTLQNCHRQERAVRERLTMDIDALDKKVSRLREKILKSMTDFRNLYPLETQEIDDSIQAAPEYREFLARLCEDDLPRFEERFKELLNENTIREIAAFQSQLYRERETIKDRIEMINGSLRAIDYNPGRYIFLELEKSVDPEVRDFQKDLKACTEGALTGSDDAQYSEKKFLQVQAIVQRFKGRDGMTELDKRWRRKVTDVRQWFHFSASERRKSDDTEFEHYTDSGGKSGGQKEKLAYTILAASLSYQYGLEKDVVRSRKFHFVVIDEAFGRSSDDSAKFGLELFRTLDLQLLIVTPLQKIHIIEPYVSSVGFCANPEQKESFLQNLTIEEYHEKKARWNKE